VSPEGASSSAKVEGHHPHKEHNREIKVKDRV
jgi:hypothetical protein